MREEINKIFKKHQSNFGELDIDSCVDDIVNFVSNTNHKNITNVQVCPICKGNGIVPYGFYNQTSGFWVSSSNSTTQCKSCYGKGFIKF